MQMSPQESVMAARRAMERCNALADITETPGQLTRVYLSREHIQANAQVARWMEQAGMVTWQDAVGNICGRYEGTGEGGPALLLGSHLDSVRNAGRYDGPLGVISAIEVVDWLHRHQLRAPQAIEIVGFGDEEGTRFGITLLGSRGLCGDWPPEWLAITDSAGISVAQALVNVGLDPARIGEAARPEGDFSGYLELHIEQGPVLEQQDLAVGVVSAINGARRLRCRFEGQAGHAGTVPMGQRRDALAGAAQWIQQIEQTTTAMGQDLVATVGTLSCSPGAVNVIPGRVDLSLDLRSPQDEQREILLNQLLGLARQTAGERGLSFSEEIFYTSAATPCDTRLQAVLTGAAQTLAEPVITLPSGAGHDAMAMATLWPVGMLFVRCKGGISHHPAESVEEADVARALRVYSQGVYQLTLEEGLAQAS